MRRIFWLLVLLPVLVLTGCLPSKQKAALQINSLPTASIFINGKNVGKTPFTDREMNPGEINLKLIPESTSSALTSWEGKIKLVAGVMSVISREFSEDEGGSSGDILTLEPIRDKKTSSLAVVTFPDGAMVKIDGENRGFSPLVLEKLGEGEHQIVLSLSEYKERLLRAKTINGYKLIVNSELAKIGQESELSETTPAPTIPAGKSSPTPSVKVTPRPTVAISGAYVTIKDTETGWLRVRSGPGKSYGEVTKVYPEEKYPFIEEDAGWYKITYAEGKNGWISADYALKSE